MLDFFRRLFDVSDFPPRWHCGQWTEGHGWLHIVSDLAIWGAYTTIPIALVIVSRRHRALLNSRLFKLFAAFIFLCGAVHLTEAVIFWNPVYRFAGVLKAMTAVVSWTTALALIRVAPRALQLPELESTNRALRGEIERRERTERQLEQSDARYRHTFESAPVGIAHVAKDGRWLRVNRTLCEFLGYSRDQLAELDFQSITHPDDLADDESQVAALLEGRIERYSIEKRYVRRDGQIVWAMLTVTLADEGTGVEPYFISVIQDLTERKRQETEVQRAREAAEAANRARGAFLANMSHEIRTPIAAILGHAEILLRELDDPDDIQGVRTIKRSGEHLVAIVNDILDLSRIEADRLEVDPEPCDLGALLHEIGALMEVRAESTAATFRVEAETDLPTNLRTDPTRVRQVLINLIGNALKFTPEGSVAVRARYDGVAEEVRIAVADTGIGIPPGLRATIFEPFGQGDTTRTRRYEGTGLGLAISRRLAGLLGGSIELESAPGKGSTFTFVLPARGEELEFRTFETAPVVDDLDSASPPPEIDARVLLVDDRRDIRNVGEYLLGEAGADVRTASDGAEALVEVARAEEEGHPFDVIVMDVQMPVMDGHTATRELRARGFTGAIVALTANAMREDELRALKAGCDAYLAKPLEADTLVTRVSELSDPDALAALRRELAEGS